MTAACRVNVKTEFFLHAVKRVIIPITKERVFFFYFITCFFFLSFFYFSSIIYFCGGGDDGIPVAFVRHDRPALSPLKLLFFVVFREESCASRDSNAYARAHTRTHKSDCVQTHSHSHTHARARTSANNRGTFFSPPPVVPIRRSTLWAGVCVCVCVCEIDLKSTLVGGGTAVIYLIKYNTLTTYVINAY